MIIIIRRHHTYISLTAEGIYRSFATGNDFTTWEEYSFIYNITSRFIRS